MEHAPLTVLHTEITPTCTPYHGHEAIVPTYSVSLACRGVTAARATTVRGHPASGPNSVAKRGGNLFRCLGPREIHPDWRERSKSLVLLWEQFDLKFVVRKLYPTEAFKRQNEEQNCAAWSNR